ncbi:MAG: energy transducer TonB [Rufibacter sp.]
MEPRTAIATTLDDLIFEGRNKAYGAYLLRKLYHRHLSQAILIAIGGVSLLISIPLMVNELVGEDVISVTSKPKTGELKFTPVELPKEQPKIEQVEEPQGSPSKSVSTIKDVTPKVKPDHLVEVEEIPTRKEVAATTAGLTTTEGDGPATVDNPIIGNGKGEGSGEGTGNGEAAAPEPAFFVVVEQMPEFEGGMKKLMSFLNKNIHYPAAAQRAGVEGTVVMSFVVSSTGELTDITVLKGLGYGTEEEALRVLKKMPRWKPGVQNGRSVPVRMTLPIRLELK